MNTGRDRTFLFVLSVFLLLIVNSRAADTVTSANRFQPIPLERFYQRLFTSYRTNEPFGAVPRGLVEFDGVPFRMFGKIDMNGLGPSRDNNYLPTRIGEIPVGRRTGRLHLITGAGYNDPDHTPIAAVRWYYTNGEVRQVFLYYSDHVRNWFVDPKKPPTGVSDPNSRIIWNGSAGPAGQPLRLFKNTLDNPLPTQEVRSLELLSLFGRAFPIFFAITLEETATSRPTPLLEEPDDTPFRRELLLTITDQRTRANVTNAMVEITVSEAGREYRFGRHRSDRHGQVLVDYPPAKFEAIDFRVSAPGYLPLNLHHARDDGLYPPAIPIALIPAREERPMEPPANP